MPEGARLQARRSLRPKIAAISPPDVHPFTGSTHPCRRESKRCRDEPGTATAGGNCRQIGAQRLSQNKSQHDMSFWRETL